MEQVTDLELGLDTEISILKLGAKISYQVPSFSVIIVDIRQITYQVLSKDGAVRIFDGFIRADVSLDLGEKTPFSVQIKDFCFVAVGSRLYCLQVLCACVTDWASRLLAQMHSHWNKSG